MAWSWCRETRAPERPGPRKRNFDVALRSRRAEVFLSGLPIPTYQPGPDLAVGEMKEPGAVYNWRLEGPSGPDGKQVPGLISRMDQYYIYERWHVTKLVLALVLCGSVATMARAMIATLAILGRFGQWWTLVQLNPTLQLGLESR